MRSGISAIMALLSCLFVGCIQKSDIHHPMDVGPEDPKAGKSFFLPSDDVALGKADEIQGSPGLALLIDSGASAVWEIRNQWTDSDTDEARFAGLAWGENSGLTWNEKYTAWVDSMEQTDSVSYFKTYELTTPYGKTLPAPALECAETSIFLRVAFASWYGLPFFLEAKDRQGRRLYLGHFGFRTADGRYPNSPNFKSRYDDHRADSLAFFGWPEDESLRSKHLGGSQDDEQPFLFEGAPAGAYFDEIFLNKRVGHFMIYALSYFGSMNLADSRNTYNIKASAIRPGDTQLERWQRSGIGHTLVVKEVNRNEDGSMEVELISGSMPRRQGKWDDSPTSRTYLLDVSAGGPGVNHQNRRYASLGGGLKRWRIAQPVSGRWANIVDPADTEVFISNRDYDAIAGRLAEFETLIKEVSLEEREAVLLAQIEDKRNHLRQYPASCAARRGREDAFANLYAFAMENKGLFKEDVDGEYRRLEDYVFAELDYDRSKTCCWNSTTAAMYEIIMAYNITEQNEAIAQQQCLAPTVFKNSAGGYSVFKEYADSVGRGSEWVEWSEDESCPQRSVRNDTLLEEQPTPFCDIQARHQANGDTANTQPTDAHLLCENTCDYANDGECDDGGPDSLYSVCDFGSDCGDCGQRTP